MYDKRRKRVSLVIPAVAIGLLLLASVATAQSDGYDLSWWTVDSGGVTSNSGGSYSLGGTAGQPDAGVLSGEGYTLGGGFWVGLEAEVVERYFYLPLVLRDF